MVIASDKGIQEPEILAECSKFLNFINVYYIMDKDDLLTECESPMDDEIKFQKLIRNNKYSYVRG